MSYFRDPESVREFFKPSHPGIPDQGAEVMQRLTMKGGTGIGLSRVFRSLED
jgi:hypothetical protein